MKGSILCALLRVVGWGVIVLGALAVAFGTWAFGAVAALAMHHLDRLYDPQGPESLARYRDLYNYARLLMVNLNLHGQGIYVISGFLGVMLGVVTLLWVRDKHRLLALTGRSGESDARGLSCEGAGKSRERRGWVWLLAGVLLGGGLAAGGVYIAERLDTAELQRWHVYTFIYQPPVLEAAQEFYRQEGRWPRDVGELVGHELLPEWSEIYLPPGCVGGLDEGVYSRVVPQDGKYHVADYVTNSVAGVTAHFSKAPYAFREEQGRLIIRIADNTPGLFSDLVLDPPQPGRQASTPER